MIDKFIELQALEKSAAALNQTTWQVETNLATITSRINMFLDELRSNQGIDMLNRTKNEIYYAIDKLQDTSTIIDLVIISKQLEKKLSELDNYDKKDGVEIEDLDKVVFIDPEAVKRIEQKLELDSLISTLYPEDAKTLKNIINKYAELSHSCRVKDYQK